MDEAGAMMVVWEEGREETGNEITECTAREVRGVERGDGEDGMADEWQTSGRQKNENLQSPTVSTFKFILLLFTKL
jgi:hypothetical protein